MDDLEYRVGRLTLAPGDILVIQSDRLFSRDTADRIAASARRIVGENTKVLVLDGAIDLSVLTRAEIEARS